MAPYITEELWERRGETGSVHVQRWPAFDAAKIERSIASMVVQVDGKVRDKIDLPAGSDDDAVVQAALNSARVRSALRGRPVTKTVVVRDRLVNLVAG